MFVIQDLDFTFGILSFSMHLRALCFLAWISLNLAAETTKWEVINDVKTWNDDVSRDELLSEEELIPFKAPRQSSKPKSSSSKGGSSSSDSSDSRPPRKVVHVNPPPAKQPAEERNLDEELLLPLGVGGKRRLLQTEPLFGPKLPPELELKRLPKLKVEAVNLSSPCKETDDDDCLFDVEQILVQKLEKASTITQQDYDGDDLLFAPDFDDDDVEDDEDVADDAPLSRHKRQASKTTTTTVKTTTATTVKTTTAKTTTRKTATVKTEEGSGSEISDLYAPDEHHETEGTYVIRVKVSIKVRNRKSASDSKRLSEQDKEDYKKEIRTRLRHVFKDYLSFIDFRIGEPSIDADGNVTANWAILLDGGAAASKLENGQKLQDAIEALLRAGIPNFNNMTIFGELIDPSSQLDNSTFVGEVISSLFNYCTSAEEPCGNEYDTTACANTGFMQGSCPHKCKSYGCQNGAVCELNDRYVPKCICGSKYRGQYCEIERKKEKVLSTAETVGVSLGAIIAGAALISCCCFFICCRKKSDRNLAYTYYEDEEQLDHVSDPTSIANYFIDRPQIRTSPIQVFNTNAGFDA